MNGEAPVLHATLVATRLGCGWRGALLRGASGVGKSDLALRLVAGGWRLVADDRTRVWTSDGRLFGRAPATLAGLVEARHLGIAPTTALPLVQVSLIVDCIQDAGLLDRVPPPRTVRLLQVELACVRLRAREASAPVKVGLGLQAAAGALTAAELAVSSGRASPSRAPREDV